MEWRNITCNVENECSSNFNSTLLHLTSHLPAAYVRANGGDSSISGSSSSSKQWNKVHIRVWVQTRYNIHRVIFLHYYCCCWCSPLQQLEESAHAHLFAVCVYSCSSSLKKLRKLEQWRSNFLDGWKVIHDVTFDTTHSITEIYTYALQYIRSSTCPSFLQNKQAPTNLVDVQASAENA